MKVFTRNEFSAKQRIILGMMATMEIESEMDRAAIFDYWRSIASSIAEQVRDIGGTWDLKDLNLLGAVGQRILDTQGIGQRVRESTDAALLQAAELHPLLGRIRPEFIE
jgi:hypothetical protein